MRTSCFNRPFILIPLLLLFLSIPLAVFAGRAIYSNSFTVDSAREIGDRGKTDQGRFNFRASLSNRSGVCDRGFDGFTFRYGNFGVTTINTESLSKREYNYTSGGMLYRMKISGHSKKHGCSCRTMGGTQNLTCVDWIQYAVRIEAKGK